LGTSRGGENARIKFAEGGSPWTSVGWWIVVKGQPNTSNNTPIRDTDDNRRITAGQSLNGTISPGGDVDPYWFEANSGSIIKINMSRTSGNLDPLLILYKPDGQLLKENDDIATGNLNSEIQITLPVSGRYRIDAKKYKYTPTAGNYRLSVSTVNAENTDSDDGQYLSFIGSALEGKINTNGDRDTYYFNGMGGRSVKIRMDRITQNLDGYLELYGPSGQLITQDDDSGGNSNPLIEHRLPSSGTYRVVARSWEQRSNGRYSIEVRSLRNNYALGVSPLASSLGSDENPSSLATDDDQATSWSSSEAVTQRLQVDLGEIQTLDQATLFWNGEDYATGYGLYYEDENQEWQPLFATESGDGGIDTIAFDSISTNKILLEMWGREELSNRYSISEFELHDTARVIIPLTLPDDGSKPAETGVTPLVPLAPVPDGKELQPLAPTAGQVSFPLSDADAIEHIPTANIPDTYTLPTVTMSISNTIILDNSSVLAAAVDGTDPDNGSDGDGIVEYRWTLASLEISNTGAYLIHIGEEETVSISKDFNLSLGDYLLRLEVQDDEGSWSTPIEKQITVGANIYLPLINR